MFVSRGGVPLGEIGRHQIRLDLFSFGFFGLLIYMQSDIQTTAAFLVAVFVSILIHELGHALMIQVLVKESTVIVIGFGGATFHNYIRQPKKQLLVSLGGPILGFVGGLLALGGAVLFIPGHPAWPGWRIEMGMETWELALNFFIWASLLWSILNLVPVIPLDGGQALRAFLIVIGVPNRPARLWTRRLTLVLVILLGGWAVVVLKMMIIGLIAAMSFMAIWDEANREGW